MPIVTPILLRLFQTSGNPETVALYGLIGVIATAFFGAMGVIIAKWLDVRAQRRDEAAKVEVKAAVKREVTAEVGQVSRNAEATAVQAVEVSQNNKTEIDELRSRIDGLWREKDAEREKAEDRADRQFRQIELLQGQVLTMKKDLNTVQGENRELKDTAARQAVKIQSMEAHGKEQDALLEEQRGEIRNLKEEVRELREYANAVDRVLSEAPDTETIGTLRTRLPQKPNGRHRPGNPNPVSGSGKAL